MSALAAPAPTPSLARRLSAAVRDAPAWTITAAASVAYLIAAPPSPDLAAAAYRSDLLSRVGFTLWDNSWYGGHHLPAYSLLAPALGALIGPRLLTALAMTAAAAIFPALIAGRFSARATRAAALWLALGASVGLLSSRVPFDLGLALALGALVLSERPAAVFALTLLSSIASPVAGAFLGLAFLSWALATRERRTRVRAATLTVTALAPIGLLALSFPEGGTQPFVASAFYPALAGVLAIGLAIPSGGDPSQRTLRIGAALYCVALVGSFAIPTAVGGNADRLGALFAGPVAACLLGSELKRRWRRWLLVAISPALLYWQANAPTADFASAVEDPAVNASYYRPLLAELQNVLHVGYGQAPARIEVVATADHWEARWLAPHIPLARGWERQLDRYRNGLFYDEAKPLTAAAYLVWLHAQSVSYVALPDAPLDYSAREEARTLTSTPALREIWRSAHWRLYAVPTPTPLAEPPARLSQLTTDSFALAVPRAGSYLVKLHFTPYWAPVGSPGACVAKAPGDWTELRVEHPETVAVAIRFSLTRIFGAGPRCD